MILSSAVQSKIYVYSCKRRIIVAFLIDETQVQIIDSDEAWIWGLPLNQYMG